MSKVIMKMENDNEDTQQTAEEDVVVEVTAYMYSCGGCDVGFETAYTLHDHLQQHVEGGSYYYDHVLRIAYPKYDTFCRMVQTDFHDCDGAVVHGEHDVWCGDTVDTVSVDCGHKQGEALTQAFPQDNDNEEKCGVVIPVVNADSFIKTSPKITDIHDTTKMEEQLPVEVVKNSEPETFDTTSAKGKIKLCTVCGKRFRLDKHLQDHLQNQHSSEVGQSQLNSDLRCKTCGKQFVRRDRLIHHTNNVKCSKKRSTKGVKLEETDAVKTVVENSVDRTDESTNTSEVHVSDVDLPSRSVKKGGRVTRMKYTKKTSKCGPVNPNKGRSVILSKGAPVTARTYRKKDKGPVECGECGVVMPRYKIEVHSRVHTGDRPYTCTQCGKGLISELKLRRHQLLHSTLRPHTCPECGATFTARYKLQMHVNSHRGIKPHLCAICGAEFSLSSNLSRHIKCIHVGDKCFQCDQCSSKFVRKSQLATHLLSHTSERTLTCRYCGKQFKYRQGLRRHEKLHATPEGGLHVCDSCGHSFSRKENLERHKQVHKEANLKCPVCLRKFRHEKSLVQHQKLHKRESDDAKLLDEQYTEVKHMTVPVELPVSVLIHPKFGGEVTEITKLHTELHDQSNTRQVLQCTQCSTTFVDARSLEIHEQTHFDKLYSCKFCSIAFLDVKLLSEHEASHLDAYTYYCGDCSQKFETELLLNDHKQATHRSDGGEFHCLMCCESFNNTDTYVSHMQRQHLIDREQRSVPMEDQHCLTVTLTTSPLLNTESSQVDEGTQFDGLN